MYGLTTLKIITINMGSTLVILFCKKIAETIDNSLLRTTDISARYDDEEFVILLPETDADSGFSVAEKVRTNVELLKVPLGKPDMISNMTVSIGVASLIGAKLNAIDLLKRADKALYLAKDSGRNNCQILNTE
mgnify:CR=1 FL=1